VRFRSGPSTDYSILGTYDRGKTLTVLSTLGEWTHCRIDGQDGYICTQYVQITETQTAAPAATVAPTLATAASTAAASNTYSGPSVGYIKGNNVRFRASPDSSSEILAELFYGNAVTITGVYGSWTAIIYDTQAGYVYSEYVATGSAPAASSAASGTPTGRELADFALSFVGYPYTWGGKDPSTGFDCSGLMYYVFKHFGYTLNRVAAEQALNGRHVEASEMQPGDLLCFYSGGSYIGHVGLYIGDNMFVHAANSSSGVITSSVTGYYATRGFVARRIL
jgi:cell wall-associated NlpC family hydrolase